MIAELEPLTRPLLFFDTETTGPDPVVDRIVSIAFIHTKPDGSEKRWQTLINPGIPIPREATYGNGGDYPGHGITNAMVQGCRKCYERGQTEVSRDQHDAQQYGEEELHDFAPWPKFSDIAANLYKGFSDADLGTYNGKRFDLPLMVEEFKRCGIEWGFDKVFLVDVYRIWQYCDPRSLTDACRFFLGREPSGAHSALSDIEDTIEVFRAQLRKYDQLPRSLEKLHALMYPRDPNTIDPDGKIIWKNGEAVMNFGTKYKGVPLKKMARRDLDWIVNKATGLSPSVKAICKDAMFGKFPDQPKLAEVQ